ncbi:type II toxin-antitoxin system RelE/ParE family toxin [Modicisalibacter radicis]|uniref:type II toxin-antitoxin system RelE/ParE family toxin n=1 Tax=Halomonas sp. EAR18 TaxID=2518972 RepID=UPI00109C1C25|nr:type II toxin-antitoxin system RelE/ParE family toxin [Halomonas sp. EAR18]
MRVRWLARALRDLEAIADYIAEDNPGAALRMVDRVESCTEGLADSPHRGRAGRVDGTRELVVTGTPYLVIYRVTTSTVDVLRVLHGAQQWPPVE